MVNTGRHQSPQPAGVTVTVAGLSVAIEKRLAISLTVKCKKWH